MLKAIDDKIRGLDNSYRIHHANKKEVVKIFNQLEFLIAYRDLLVEKVEKKTEFKTCLEEYYEAEEKISEYYEKLCSEAKTDDDWKAIDDSLKEDRRQFRDIINIISKEIGND